MVRALQDNAIDAEIIVGQHVWKRVFIPRLPLSPSDDISLPFKFKRKQFPVRLSFAMTINKSQGQTIPNVGIYLLEPVFSHGQLYVGLSRGGVKINNKNFDKTNRRLGSYREEHQEYSLQRRPKLVIDGVYTQTILSIVILLFLWACW
jgi:ATP-dependent DNA helicase PIF1